jgi:dTDP-L-rhamnose 4-epimerase
MRTEAIARQTKHNPEERRALLIDKWVAVLTDKCISRDRSSSTNQIGVGTMSKTVLITGGAGFIGRKLAAQLLACGMQVRILDSLSPQVHGMVPRDIDWLADGSIEFVRGSVTGRMQWQQALDGVTCVAHLAAETGTGQSMYEIAKYNEINSQGTALMFDVLAEQKSRSVQRVVLTSSRSVYGEGTYRCDHCGVEPIFPQTRLAIQLSARRWEPACQHCNSDLTAVPTAETDAVRPASIYAATKLAQEDLVRVSCDALGIGYAIFRLQNVYGAGQSLQNPYTGILSVFSTRIRRGVVLPLFEDGLESRDFVHVDDVVQALLLGLQSETAANTVLNVGSGHATSVHDIAVSLTKAFGKPPNVKITGEFRIGDIRHNFANIDSIRSKLGFSPRVNLEKGLEDFAEWVLNEPLPEDRLDQANSELRARKLMGG